MVSVSRLFIQIPLLLWSLLMLSALHAQAPTPGVNCVPIQTPDWTGCAPNNSEQQASTRWVDQWGAIATDAPGQHMGTANNLLTKEEARQAAITNCEAKSGSPCKIEIAYYNQCTAMVVGDKTHAASSAPTIDKAVAIGIKNCAKGGDTNCHAYYTACSFPKQIQ